MTIDEAIEYHIKVATQRAIADKEMGVNDNSHWNETIFMNKKQSEQIIADNQQLAKWLTQLKEAKRLLKAAVEDFNYCDEFCYCYYNIGCGICADCNKTPCDKFQWRYADEVKELIKEI